MCTIMSGEVVDLALAVVVTCPVLIFVAAVLSVIIQECSGWLAIGAVAYGVYRTILRVRQRAALAAQVAAAAVQAATQAAWNAAQAAESEDTDDSEDGSESE